MELKEYIKNIIRDIISEKRNENEYFLINEGVNDSAYIGSFYVIEDEISPNGHLSAHNALSEVKIGDFKKTKYDVLVYTNDGGYIPHIHILDPNSRGGNFDCCVKIEKPEYFPHGEHTSIMSHKILKAFIKFINSTFVDNRGNLITYYQMAVEQWNYSNSKKKILCKYNGNTLVMPIVPNYSLLNKEN